MNDIRFAIAGAIFWTAFSVLLFTAGSPVIKTMVLWMLLMGALSQFLAQDPSLVARVTALFVAWSAILLAIASMFTYTLGY